ncbi:epoxide hydrolase [Fusarium heterosporum]|uniref:Epoxide hydrolase n=1 Tax=Fusarium heterosporum TaxID=42747 RepID=A0A8H5SWY1_FUSHE|nr:epoxide hydrolase [Fusarium heterosporum]
MDSNPFGRPPHHVPASANLTPSNISIPDSEIQRLKTLLELSPIPEPNLWNAREDGAFGLPRDTLLKLVNYWANGYDWKKWESSLNSIPQFTIRVTDDDSEDFAINFFALFSKKPSAIPVLFLHGWPGSVVEYFPILQKLQSRYDAEALPYHIVVPHHIGFPFSDTPPLDKEFTHFDNARLMSKMMHALGFGERGYVAQGGDLGGWTAPVIANIDPACKLVHMNMLNVPPPAGEDVENGMKSGLYSADEIAAFARMAEFGKKETAFIQLDGTKPATAGYLFASNPVALLAWIGDKIIRWTDKTPGDDLILTNIALWWFSGCYPTSIYLHRTVLEDHELMMNAWKILKVPLGYSAFKKELVTAPERWIQETGQISWYRMHEQGGHFAALEEPDTLWKDVEDFVAEFWEKA